MIVKIFNPTVELAMATGTSTNEVNAKIGKQPLTAKTKIKKMLKVIQNTKPYFMLVTH